MSYKDTTYNVSSRYISSDQWMQTCVYEDFTYSEYCESARNNEKVVYTLEQFLECRDWMEEEAYFQRWPDLSPDLDPRN